MMKIKYITKVLPQVIFLCGFFVSTTMGQEMDNEVIDPYMQFSYWKNTLDQKVLQVKMTYFTDVSQPPLEGLSINFYMGETEPFLLGSLLTDHKGFAKFEIPDSIVPDINVDNQMYFYAEFEGSDKINPALEEVYVQDVFLKMALEQSDGERKIMLEASTVVDGDTLPVTDEDIYIYVPRMFSDLQVGDGYFEEDGTATVDFPIDIPGDSIGNITIIARFNDHYLYGNVEKREFAPWGVPSYHEGPGDVRALWTQVAPKWMIVTLTILLLGVWGHYLFTIISLVRISKNGKGA